jgi:hypothetical protein
VAWHSAALDFERPPHPACARTGALEFGRLHDFHGTSTQDTGLGVYIVDLPTQDLVVDSVCFTFYWCEADKCEGANFQVVVEREAFPMKQGLAVDVMHAD